VSARGGARRALGALLGLVVRAWLATLRFTVEEHPDLAAAATRPWVLALWHGQQLVLFGHRRRRRTVALVSLSEDGELLAGALPRFGLAVVRGSSSRGGARGLVAVIKRLRDGLDAAFAVDGPRGPRRSPRADASGRVGAVVAAERVAGVVVPYASACAAGWTLRSWDRFELPRPFSRVAIVLGPPLEPAETDARALATAIDLASARARALLGVATRVD
jgi:lysophospholipid acyltransferase (LPLAT)-like uncharacterized protein